jgi:competence protein CoiA
MQLYALDSNKQLVSASQAAKQINYFCLECHSFVRLRAGLHRQSHFYHLQPTIFCRQHQKGVIHLNLQNYFIQQLPLGEVTLECRFPTIRRIADVAWHPHKIIFEVQCSPISAEEVNQRNVDYQTVGWQVIWILHDQRYNQSRLSAAEIVLQHVPHFYTNMSREGKGMIYDQFEMCQKGLRSLRFSPLPIQPQYVYSCKADLLRHLNFYQRRAKWGYYFAGDLLHLELNDSQVPYIQKALLHEKEYFLPNLVSEQRLWKGLKRGVNTLWHLLLERACR